MTLADLRLQLCRRLNYPDTPDSAIQTRLTMFLNQRHRALLTTPALRQLRDGFGKFVSVASQAEYALPYGVARITAMRETLNERTLTELSWDVYRQSVPNPANNVGTADAWAPIGVRAILRSPAAQGLWAVSSSAADTTQGVVLTASLSATAPRGLQQTTTTTLTGTTRVRLGGATDTFDDVESISLNAATAGSITVFDAAAAGNLVATIFAGRRNSRCYAYALVPTPGSALTYDIDYEYAVIDLANTWDEPLVPEDFGDLLVWGALADEYQHRDDTRYVMAQQEYAKRLSDLKCYLFGHRAATVSGRERELAPLGSWYPFQRP